MLQAKGIPTDGFDTDEAVVDAFLSMADDYERIRAAQATPPQAQPAVEPPKPEPKPEEDDWAIDFDQGWLTYLDRDANTGLWKPRPGFEHLSEIAYKANQAIAKQNRNLQKLASGFPTEVKKHVAAEVAELKKEIDDLKKELQGTKAQTEVDRFLRERQDRIWQQTPQGWQKTPQAKQAEEVVERLRKTGADNKVLMQVFDAILGPPATSTPAPQSGIPDNGQAATEAALAQLGQEKRRAFLDQALNAQRPTDLSAVPSQPAAPSRGEPPKTAKQLARELLIETGRLPANQ